MSFSILPNILSCSSSAYRRATMRLRRSLASNGTRRSSIWPVARMKTSRRCGVQPGEDPRNVIGRSLLGADQLHARAKAAGLEALTTRKTALEQAQDPRPPAAGAQEKRPAAPVRKPSKRQRDHELHIVELDGRGLRLRRDVAQGPQPGHADGRQIIERGLHVCKNRLFEGQKSRNLCAWWRAFGVGTKSQILPQPYLRSSLDAPRRHRPKPRLGPPSRMASSAFRRPAAASSGRTPNRATGGRRGGSCFGSFGSGSRRAFNFSWGWRAAASE